MALTGPARYNRHMRNRTRDLPVGAIFAAVLVVAALLALWRAVVALWDWAG